MNTSSLKMKQMADYHKDILQYIYDLTFPGRPVGPITQAMLLKSAANKNSSRNLLQGIDIDDLRNLILQAHTNTIGKISKYVHNLSLIHI